MLNVEARSCSKCFARPVVKRYRTTEGDENWRMWYSGRDKDFDSTAIGISTGRIGLCESDDGINWKRVAGDEELGSVLNFNSEEWWGYDTVHTMAGDVQIISTDKVRGSSMVSGGYGVNFMFVSGGDAEEVDMGGVSFGGKTLPEGTEIKGLRMRIGLALSYDGIHWTRMEGDHHTGAVFDVGEDGEFDSLLCGWPQVGRRQPFFPQSAMFVQFSVYAVASVTPPGTSLACQRGTTPSHSGRPGQSLTRVLVFRPGSAGRAAHAGRPPYVLHDV